MRTSPAMRTSPELVMRHHAQTPLVHRHRLSEHRQKVPAAESAGGKKCRRQKVPAARSAGGKKCRRQKVPAARSAGGKKCRRQEVPISPQAISPQMVSLRAK
jgi:hypothetical protein